MGEGEREESKGRKREVSVSEVIVTVCKSESSTCIPFCVFSVSSCLFYYQVTRQLLHSSVFMSLTWRDSLSVRRCASIAVPLLKKVQYAHNWYNLLHYYTKDNTIDK